MTETKRNDFFESAIRHLVDGQILEEHEEYDNAVCMQGFAAECALKAILEKGISSNDIKNKIFKYYGHRTDVLLSDLEMMLLNDTVLTAILDPASGLRLSKFSIPHLLTDDHPERRYFNNGVYKHDDAIFCREHAELYVKEMLRLYLDGYIEELR